MKKILKILIFFTLFPSIVLGAIIKDGGGGSPATPSETSAPSEGDFMGKLKSLVGVLVEIVAAISVIELVYAGFLLATAQGDPEKAKTAKSILIYATLGIGVAALAWALGQLVISALK